ncbi:MAG: S66 peptidase family protein [Lachnospiraceae bacterium]
MRLTMIFPKWIRAGKTIGVTALSDGVTDELDRARFLHAKDILEAKGHSVEFTPDVFSALPNGSSADGRTRAREFNELILRDDVDAVVSAKGGVYLAQMLPYVDYESAAARPKWIQGYSDNTSLLFCFTTKYDVATVYGSNFGDFGMEPWHESITASYETLCGLRTVQNSFSKYQNGFGPERITGLEGYVCDEDVCWVNGSGEEELTLRGRLIGGCADVLFFLNGTAYDGALSFCERYKDDGILWYLETFQANADDFVMQLWHLKELGWFRYASGILFGRPLMFDSRPDTDYRDTVMYMLGDLNIPIIFDVDIGHKAPRMCIVNGALATVKSGHGRGRLVYAANADGTFM